MTVSKHEGFATRTDGQPSPRPEKHSWSVGPLLLWTTCVLGAIALGANGTASQWHLPQQAGAAEAVVCSSLALVIATAFVWLVAQRWDGKLRYPSSFFAWCMLLSAGAICLVGFALHWNTMTSLGMIAILACWLYAHQSIDRSGSLLYFAPPLIVLWCIPIQALQIVERLAGQLLGIAIMPALDWLQIPFQQLPSAIFLSNGTLELGQFFLAPTTSLLFCCALLVVSWYRRPLASIPFYMASTLIWAFGLALVKIAIIVSYIHGHSASVLDWQFALLSLFGFAVAGMLILSSDRLIRVLLFQIPDHEKNLLNNPLHRTWNRLFRQMAVSGKVLATVPVDQDGYRR